MTLSLFVVYGGSGVMVFLFIFAALVIEGAYRVLVSQARGYKHSKTYVRKWKKENPFWRRVLDIYTIPECKAPCHLRKYQRIRAINLLALVVCSALYQVLPVWAVIVYMVVFLIPAEIDRFRLNGFKNIFHPNPPLEFDNSPNP